MRADLHAAEPASSTSNRAGDQELPSLDADRDMQIRYLAVAVQTVKEAKMSGAIGAGPGEALHPPMAEGFHEALRALARNALQRWRTRFSPVLFPGDLFVAARRARLHPLRTLRLLLEIRLVRASGLIDSEFYAPQKARTEIPDWEDARNYVLVGHRLDPNRMFSGTGYLALHPDAESRPLTPLAHYIRFGRREGRRTVPPRPEFPRPTDPESRPQHDWPLSSKTRSAPLGIGDHRPDDIILRESQAGRDFMERFGLLGSAPDFGGAVAALQQIEPPSCTAPASADRPAISVIVPVYGQLAYTLNCLHSLLEHRSRFSFEILVGDDASPDESGLYLSQIPHVRYVLHAVNSGFIDNCNTTAALARGDHIVLLNNDTRVAPGWLDALIDSFALFPKAGMVGSKLFFDDGALQEAGGILWRDGSAWNYGRDDDPNRPRYCFARQVDYVSGASIALPTALWRALGGFDRAYWPAYCEDSELAFRVRAEGLQVWMQPLSRVIHYEGRTSGTDLTQGVKAYQTANSVKLAKRWAEQLRNSRENGDMPFLERERAARKRVLVIDATTPTPRQDAGSVTSVMHMRLYQDLGYKVYFAPLDNFLFQEDATAELQRQGIECVYAPYEPDLEHFLTGHGRYLDIIHVFRVDVAVAALDLLRRYAPQAPIIFANMDMHHLRMERQAATENDPELLAAAREMKIKELDLISSVDCTIIHSPVEEAILRAETPDAELVVFPFITPWMGTSASFEERRDIMFLGGYRHTPNIDAAVFLAREIWPLVRPQLPSARLLIVGAHPTAEIEALAEADVLVTGPIDDLRTCFDGTRVFAASIRYGAGVKGKVATAMSYGVPVVATNIAAEGMFLVDGRDVRVADDPVEFANAVVEIYNSPAEWSRYSQNGLAFVADWNSLDRGREVLAQAIARGIRQHAKRVIAEARATLAELLPTDA